MSKLKTTLTLIMLFIIAFNFTSTAQLQAKVKSRPIDQGCFLCTSANPDGTVDVSVSLKLTGITFNDCEDGMYSGINNLPCDLHVGLTDLESGETFYTSVNNGSYRPVDGQDSLMDVDCNYPLSPFEVSGFYTKLQFTIPSSARGDLDDCDDLGMCRGVQYYGQSFNIFLDFYCATSEGFETVNFCDQAFEPLIEGIKKCDESKTSSVTVCCDVATTNDTPADPIGGDGLRGNSKNYSKANSLDKIQIEFNDASVSIFNRNTNENENLRFEIINLNGKLISRGQILSGAGMHTILHNAEMTTGIYVLRVYNTEGIITKKFFKS